MIRERQGITYESLESLEVPGLLHAFCSRNQGVSEGKYASLNLGLRTDDQRDNILANDRIVREAFSIPSLVRVSQVHGNEVLVIESHMGQGTKFLSLERDALVTDQPGLALAVLTADCVPVALYDPEKRVVAMIHSGWRGTCSRVAASALEAMHEKFGSDPQNVLAGIGPYIGPCCYKVDAPVYNAASEEFGDTARGFFQNAEPGQYLFDMKAAIVQTLVQSGVKAGNIGISGLCTACREDLFFSHRASGPATGRQLNFIMLLE